MRSVAAFRRHYHRKVAVNTAYLVPQGTVRLEVVGFRDVPLRGADLERAQRLVREGLEQGAVGFSTGSKYYPGPWADTEELVALCRSRAGRGRRLHVRAARREPGARPRRARRPRGGRGGPPRRAVRLHFAHYRTSPATAGQLDRIMEFIDPARADGLDVTFDVYPVPGGQLDPGEPLAERGAGGRSRRDPGAPARRRRAPADRGLPRSRRVAADGGRAVLVPAAVPGARGDEPGRRRSPPGARHGRDPVPAAPRGGAEDRLPGRPAPEPRALAPGEPGLHDAPCRGRTTWCAAT